MLSVKNLNVFYGAIHALHNIQFEVEQGEIVTLIGANGAGKTTTLRCISGLVPAKTGVITFAGQNLRGISPHRIVEMGLAQVPEGRRIFANLTVMENLEMGAYTRKITKGYNKTMKWFLPVFRALRDAANKSPGRFPGANNKCWPSAVL